MRLNGNFLIALSALSTSYGLQALWGEEGALSGQEKGAKLLGTGSHLAAMAGFFCSPASKWMRALNFGASALGVGANVSDIFERWSYYQENKLELAATLLQTGLTVFYGFNTKNLNSVEEGMDEAGRLVKQARKTKVVVRERQALGPDLGGDTRFLSSVDQEEIRLSYSVPKERISVPHFSDEPVPSYRTKELVAKLVGGRRFDRMVVIVHPEKGDQTIKTINFFRSSSELRETPRVLLLGPHRMQNVDYYYPGLKREVTLIAKSEEGLLGECGLTLLADEIHLAGGRYGLCFAKAIKDLVSQFRQTTQTQIRLHVHRSLVWHDTTGRTLGEDGISSITSMEWLMRARHGYTFPILPTIERNLWQRVLGRADEYVCVLPDGKKVFVVFES